MGKESARYTVNSTDIVHEVIEGEVIAIDLAKGSYYSLSGAAADAWDLLAEGATAHELARSFTSEEDAEKVERELSELLDRLAAERLVVPAATEGPGELRDANGGIPYRKPVFEKYDDMQDYFLLDPIHEVGTAGWPPPAP